MTSEQRQFGWRRPSSAAGRAGRLVRVLCVALLGAGAQVSALAANPVESPPVSAIAVHATRANFEGWHPSAPARAMADWVVDSADNHGMPFVIVDKVEATVFVFDAGGRLGGAAPALLGLAHGDDAVPGIGQRALSSIGPQERTTPAGRFVAALGRNLQGHLILWIDYDNAISLHPVVAGTRAERRAERLATPSALDNRISYGCINVALKFFQHVVSPAFKQSSGIVYVLPETRPNHAVFASYEAPAARLLAEPAPP